MTDYLPTSDATDDKDPVCNYFWGSHGCDRRRDDHTLHQCGLRDPDGLCCEYDEARPPSARVRHHYGDEHGWGEWGPYPDGFRYQIPSELR
jgi:hypothetical protein